MIYLDNAATTFPKPEGVKEAVRKALSEAGANPGRGGYPMAMATSEQVFACRQKAARFFHAAGPECVAFTLNCTHAINMALKGALRPGDHVVVSCLEHNAVMRPLKALEKDGISYTAARVFPGDKEQTLASFRSCLKPNTRLIACMQASNVWGLRLPVEELARMAHENGISMLVDCAQSAGVVEIDLQKTPIDYLCCAGHKSLYGPMGTGMLIVNNGELLSTIIEGGTGSFSSSLEQPALMPDRFESGTPNTAGIIGLGAGIDFVAQKGIKRIFTHEMKLVGLLYDRLSTIRGVKLYLPRPDAQCVPVLSFNVEGMASEDAGKKLAEADIAVRAGIHCSPLAHAFMGTLETGAIRVCPSAFNNQAHIEALAKRVASMVK